MDNLSIDLEITDTTVDATLGRNEQKIKDFARRVESIGPQLGGGNSPLNRSPVDTNAVKSAYQLEQAANAAAAGFTKTGAAVGDVGSKLSGLGPILSSLLPQEAQMVAEMVSLVGEGGAAVSVIGALGAVFGTAAVAAAVTSKITGDILHQSEQQLAIQDKISASTNNYLLALQGVTADYELQRKLLAESVQFAERLKALQGNGDTAGIAALGQQVDQQIRQGQSMVELRKNALALSEEQLKADEKRTPAGWLRRTVGLSDVTQRSIDQQVLQDKESIRQQKQQLAEEEARLAAALSKQSRVDNVKPADSTAAEAQARKFQDQLSRIEDEGREYRAKKERENIEKGIAEVNKLGKTWNSTFDSLFQRANADNPFALFLQKSASDADKLKEAIRGLPPELQKTAIAMQAVASSKDLFKLSLDASLNAINLRAQADQFRNPVAPGNGTLDPYQLATAKAFVAYNPDFLKTHKNATDSDIYGAASRNKLLEDEYRDIYDTHRKGFDKGIADRKFIDLTNGANPLDLTDGLRRAASDARLNEAARQENYLKEAQDERKQQTKIQAELLDVQKELLKIAGTGGQKALEVILKNETDGKYDARPKTPTPDDVNIKFGLPIAGGSNL
jgi:hypothetical protein